MPTQKQIECLNQAAKAKTGFSFLSLLQTADERLLDVAHDAMELYALACLKNVAENAKVKQIECASGIVESEKTASNWKVSQAYQNIYYSVDKESIISKDNLL